MNKKVFAFDLGKTSIGICAREDHQILDLKSLIINPEYADISLVRDRKKVIRTKEAHKKREAFFINNIWIKAGLIPLSKEDNRFKKEFPSKKENIIYSSTLLRIALLQNMPLEKWQIFKALHNAIQRRGYDDKLPWLSGAKAKKIEKINDDEESRKFIGSYQSLLKEQIPDEKYHYPCYLDATLLGLWNYSEPNNLCLRINHKAEPAREKNRVAPRGLVEKELRVLFENAKKQLPQLQEFETDYFLYGEGLEAYASYKNTKYLKHLGKEWDAQGALGQKIPRFENRILAKCQLLPKRNVCKANTIENIKFVLLQGLKNFRYYTPDGHKHALTAKQIEKAYFIRKPDLLKWIEEGKFSSCNINKGSIEKAIAKGFKITKDNEVNIKVNTSGRSRFCKPALKVLNEIILSDKSPQEFDISPFIQHETDYSKGITRFELEKMLERLGDSWENFHIGDNREIKENLPREQQIAKIIGSTTNPVIRHRLQWFYNELKQLDSSYGEPDEVIIEFIRGKANDVLAKRYEIKKNTKKNDDIKKKLDEAGIPLKGNFEKLKLLEIQGGKCIYTGETISIYQLPDCEIDHIVPVSQDGCDYNYNRVLCTKTANQQKAGKTSYQWLYHTNRWYEFVQRVGKLRHSLGEKKAEILISNNPIELIDHYNGLAETAQIARMSQQIVATHFGWGLQTKGDKRRVFVSNGSQTSEFRRKYKLNSLLGDDAEKNRSNLKHHALDAICISYSRDVKSINEGNKWFRGVEGFQRDYIEEKVNELMPKTVKPNTSKQKVKETIYGKRQRGDKFYLVTRKDITSIEQKEKSIKNILDDEIREDLLEKANEINSKEEWVELLQNYTHPKKQSKVKKVRLIETQSDSIEKDGNGRERIGKYCDFGNTKNEHKKGNLKGTPKGITKGQFKAADQHKGQIIYFDKKDTPRIMPVYANQKKAEVKAILKNKGYKLYKNGMFFYSSVQLYIPKEFKAGKNTHPAGVYELNTIITRGAEIKIKNSEGNIISSSAKNLIAADFELFDKNKQLVKTK